MAYTISDKCVGCGACVRICPTAAISGEKKEKHIINPDACIECGACGRLCPQGGVLDAAGRPVVRIKKPDWAKPRIDLDKCMACMSCVETCPVGCLELHERPVRERDRDNYPFLKDEKACIACGFCADECPVDAIVMVVPKLAVKPKPKAPTAKPAE